MKGKEEVRIRKRIHFGDFLSVRNDREANLGE